MAMRERLAAVLCTLMSCIFTKMEIWLPQVEKHWEDIALEDGR